jgi:hypothetical protein
MLNILTIDNWITKPRNTRGFSFVILWTRTNGPGLPGPVNALICSRCLLAYFRMPRHGFQRTAAREETS